LIRDRQSESPPPRQGQDFFSKLLEILADKNSLGEAAGAAVAAGADFDLAKNLAALFSGLAIAMTSGRAEDGLA
jgi:hypothetical protein